MSNDPQEEVARKVVEALGAAHAAGRRGFVVVRAANPAVVDAARDLLQTARTPHGWRSLPVAELDPPDLLGFIMHAGTDRGPAFLAYDLPRDLEGRVQSGFIEHLIQRTPAYLASRTLLVLIVTVQEMRAVSGPAGSFWSSRDLLVAWPKIEASSRYVPAVVSGGIQQPQRGGMQRPRQGGVAGVRGGGISAMAAGQMAGTFAGAVGAAPAGALGVQGASSLVQDPDHTPWAGAPFGYDSEEVPEYLITSAAPAGRRWGRDLAPDDPEGASLIDSCRELLDARRTEVARSQLARAAKRFRKSGNPVAAAECYVMLGRAAEDRLDHRVAFDWYKAALDAYEQIEDQAGYSDCAGYLGYLRFLHGDLDGAAEAFRRALQRDEAAEDEARQSTGQRRLGIIFEETGKLDEALEAFEKAAAIERKHNDRRTLSRSLNHMARIQRRKGELDKAEELLTQSLEIKEELDDSYGLASGYHELGNLRYQRQELDAALEAYEKALTLELEQSDVAGVAATEAQLGLVQRDRFVFTDAARSFLLARELFERLQSPHVGVINKALEAARESIDAWDYANIETEVQEWLEEFLAPPEEEPEEG